MTTIIFTALLIGGVIKKLMDKQPPPAIFSADRKALQGKIPNVIDRTFGSKPQAGKINTHTVCPTAGPQNPGGMPQ